MFEVAEEFEKLVVVIEANCVSVVNEAKAIGIPELDTFAFPADKTL